MELCSWETPFANCLKGAPGSDYAGRTTAGCWGAPTSDAAFMGLTSCRWIKVTGMIAHWRLGAQSIPECRLNPRMPIAKPAGSPARVGWHRQPSESAGGLHSRIRIRGYRRLRGLLG